MSKPVKPRLPAVIAALYARAASSGKPAEAKLERGLFLKATYQDGARALLMWRGSDATPSDLEVSIVLKDGRFGEHTLTRGRSRNGDWVMVLELPTLLSAPIERPSRNYLKRVSGDVDWKGVGL